MKFSLYVLNNVFMVYTALSFQLIKYIINERTVPENETMFLTNLLNVFAFREERKIYK